MQGDGNVMDRGEEDPRAPVGLTLGPGLGAVLQVQVGSIHVKLEGSSKDLEQVARLVRGGSRTGQ